MIDANPVLHGASMAVATALTIIANLLNPTPTPAILTHYGTEGDGYLGQHHGAYWHGDSCGLPDVVDAEHFGAAAPYSIPYCTRLLVVYGSEAVIVMVADRQKHDVIDGLPHLDLWPAAAKQLGIVELGIVEGAIFLLPH